MDNEDDSIRGRVSNAFAQHLGQLRDNLLSRQQSGQESSNHNRLLSFQDVRNHFDQLEPLDNQPNNQMASTLSKRINDKKVDNENDWEDIYHRARR